MKQVEAAPVTLAPSTRIAIKMLAILAACFALYFGRGLFLPVALAIVLALTLSPIIQVGQRVRIPAAVSAFAVMVTFTAGLFLAVMTFAEPLGTMIADAPRIGEQLKAKLKSLGDPLKTIDKVGEEVEKIATSATVGSAPEVIIKQPGLIARAADDLAAIAATILLTLTLCFFLLVSRDLFFLKVVRIMPTLSDKKSALQLANSVEHDVSHYLLTVTVINTALGTLVGVIFWALGMPNPLLWGTLAGLLNFLPYVGAIGGIVLSAAVAVITFDTLGQALAVPASYALLTILEGQFITPSLLGRRFSLNTVVILLSIAFWGFMWGSAGVFVAVPILIMLKALADQFDELAPLSEFLSGSDVPEPRSDAVEKDQPVA